MILVRLMGGLGNQMFQYAAGLALADHLGTEMKLDLTLLCSRGDGQDTYREYELDIFNIKAQFASKEEVNRFNPVSNSILERVGRRIARAVKKPRVYIQDGRGFDKGFHLLPDDVCLVGSFQSEKYFIRISSQIRTAYTFKGAQIFSESDLFDEIRRENAVAVHVRRGDYVDNSRYSQILGAKGVSYYHKAFNYIAERVSNPVLFFFSDDIAWCKANIKTAIPVCYVSNPATEEPAWKDLFLMSCCKHFIIPNSTFGWWGAWLGNQAEKIVVAPGQWSADGSLESADRIPDGWMKI